MKIVVLGAGVVGVTTAYELARDGHDVTVIDRCEGPALETSHANGGQLSWNHGEPLPGPGVVKKALAWLGRRDAPLVYRLRLDPTLWSWTLKFLANCADPAFWRNAERILRMALYSRERMQEILKHEKIAFDHQRSGILGLYQDAREFDREMEAIRAWREIGGTRDAFDRQGCIEIEPALAHSTLLISGGIHTPLDESGDCYAFTQQLAKRAETLGVTFDWNTTVKGFKRDNWEVTHVVTDRGEEDADVFVMALGSYSPLLMKGLDLNLPVYPAKGYSVTVPVIEDAMAPTMSITSNDHKLVISRLGGSLRVAGMLELGGYDTDIVHARARLTLDAALELFPRALEPEHATFWTGLRPMTPDSVPIVGRAKQHNIILNTGHGMLGWTLAAGSARIVADMTRGHAPDVDMDGLSWERFA
jgi:D-amino-acid dehydrogenase